MNNMNKLYKCIDKLSDYSLNS